MARHLGNLTVTKDNVHDFPAVAEIYGHLTIEKDAELLAPDIVHVRGWITVRGRLAAPQLGSVNGWLTLGDGATLVAPNLTVIERDLTIGCAARFLGEKLDTVGSLVAKAGALVDLPLLALVRQNVTLDRDAVAGLPRLERVGGSITLRVGAHLDAEALNHIGGYYDGDETARIVAPKFSA